MPETKDSVMSQGAVAPAQAQPLPPIVGAVLVAGWFPDGSIRYFNLGAVHEAQVLAEKAHALDRLDSRNAQKTVTIPAGSDVDTVLEAALEVPAGEVWFVNRVSLTTPAGVTGDFRVSPFPKGADQKDKLYLASYQAAGATVNYDLASAGELGEELRLVGGDKVTVVGKVEAVPAADLTVTLVLFGRKGKRLV